MALFLSVYERETTKDGYRHLQREYMNARVAEYAGRYYLAASRNAKSRRCILTSGTAHRKPENIMPRDLQFGWLAKSSSPFSLSLFICDEQSLLLSMEGKH